MPIYEYLCSCGNGFEVLARRPEDPGPACPRCGGQPTRRVSAAWLGGRASPGPGPEHAPKSWEETNGGDPDTIRYWQRTLERRAKLEEKYPELAAPADPVLAHEGRYAGAPLRASDLGTGAHATPRGASPSHAHSHGDAQGNNHP